MSALSPDDRARLARDITDLVNLGFIKPMVDPKLLPNNETGTWTRWHDSYSRPASPERQRRLAS